MAIRYEGAVPKTLRAWVERHAADKVYEVHHGGGFCTESGQAYDVALRAGWAVVDGCGVLHGVIEPTVRDTIAVLRTLHPCDCAQCAQALEYFGA